MKKNLLTLIAATLVVLVLTGCSKETPPTPGKTYNFPAGLVGAWKETLQDGNEVATNKTRILDIHSQERFSLMQVATNNETPYWQISTGTANYDKDTLTFTGIYNAPATPQFSYVYKYQLISLEGNKLRLKLVYAIENGKNIVGNLGGIFDWEKVSTVADAQIGGMWKEQQRNMLSEEKFGYYFNVGNRYDYYYYNGNVPSIKNDNEGSYWFYGNFLVLQYFNHPVDNDSKQHVECWNVSLNNTGSNNEKFMYLEAANNGVIEKYTFKHIQIP